MFWCAAAPDLQNVLVRSCDEDERVRGEGRMRHCDGVELGADEVGR